MESKPNGDSLLIKVSSSHRLVKKSEIQYIKAENSYCKLYCRNNESMLICKTLSEFGEELDKGMFFRCHKSYMVNWNFVKEIKTHKKKHFIILLDLTTIPLSRNKVREFRDFLSSN